MLKLLYSLRQPSCKFQLQTFLKWTLNSSEIWWVKNNKLCETGLVFSHSKTRNFVFNSWQGEGQYGSIKTGLSFSRRHIVSEINKDLFPFCKVILYMWLKGILRFVLNRQIYSLTRFLCLSMLMMYPCNVFYPLPYRLNFIYFSKYWFFKIELMFPSAMDELVR